MKQVLVILLIFFSTNFARAQKKFRFKDKTHLFVVKVDTVFFKGQPKIYYDLELKYISVYRLKDNKKIQVIYPESPDLSYNSKDILIIEDQEK